VNDTVSRNGVVHVIVVKYCGVFDKDFIVKFYALCVNKVLLRIELCLMKAI